MKRTVVLVEDHEIVREGIRTLIEAYSEFSVIGEAGDGIEAVRIVERLEPDIVLMDLSLPRMDGSLAIRDIKRRFPGIKILALTAHKREEMVRGALAAGADGFILKNTSAPVLMQAMETILRGETYICPEIPITLLGPGFGNNQQSVLDRLTERELQVIRLTAEGRGNKAIAHELCISVKTVEKHKANLTRKLELDSASDLLSFIREYGLFS
ncbi:MAG: response regulator transcription factor [Proteobacteria bacterium]|nr:response regulator transcription factor [Pseudomonadota bacterium]